jgi:hypothetical protein
MVEHLPGEGLFGLISLAALAPDQAKRQRNPVFLSSPERSKRILRRILRISSENFFLILKPDCHQCHAVGKREAGAKVFVSGT